jgi:predicted HD superfamily hydrolase involved in NAD metabolism
MEIAILQERLKHILSTKRFTHSIGVKHAAMELAQQFGGDIEKAALAGLLHDCAREMPSNHLLKRAEEFGIVVGSLEKSSPVLLHAVVSARIAAVEYGIHDGQVIKAIELHTTGDADMTKLDKIIFLADYIEPNRTYPGVDKLRCLARKDLDRAVLAAFDQTIRYLVKEKMVIHPASIAGRNALLTQLKDQ